MKPRHALLVLSALVLACSNSNPVEPSRALVPAAGATISAPSVITVKTSYTWTATNTTGAWNCDEGAWYFENPAGGTAVGPYYGTTSPSYVPYAGEAYTIRWYWSQTCTEPELTFATAVKDVDICIGVPCGPLE